jgi:hypothetical protein
MQQDEDDTPKEVENAGPKIKMNRIGKKSKTDGKPGSKPVAGTKEATAIWKAVGDKVASGGGFSE